MLDQTQDEQSQAAAAGFTGDLGQQGERKHEVEEHNPFKRLLVFNV